MPAGLRVLTNPFTSTIQQAIVGGCLVVIVGLGALAVSQRLTIAAVRLELGTERTARATDKAAAAESARLESERIRREEGENRRKLQEALDAERKEHERARADAAIADAAAGRLQQRVAALVAAARQAARDPGPAGGSPPAGDAAGMLADVLGRCIARLRQLGEVADARGIAGSTCERAYDALKPEGAASAPDLHQIAD